MKSFNTTLNYYSKHCKFQNPKSDSLINIGLGICVPEKCNSQEIAQLIVFGYESLPSNITAIFPFNLSNITEQYLTCVVPAEINVGAIIAM